MEGITLNGKKVVIKREKAFPDRFSWKCPDCDNWNRYFEITCPYCDWEREHRLVIAG